MTGMAISPQPILLTDCAKLFFRDEIRAVNLILVAVVSLPVAHLHFQPIQTAIVVSQESCRNELFNTQLRYLLISGYNRHTCLSILLPMVPA